MRTHTFPANLLSLASAVDGGTVCGATDGAPPASGGTTQTTPPAQAALPLSAPGAAPPAVDPAQIAQLTAALAQSEAARKATEAKLNELIPVAEKFGKVTAALGDDKKDPAEELSTLRQQSATAQADAQRARSEATLFRLATKSEAVDADDVVTALSGKVPMVDGKLDEAAAKAAIDALLASKPHWKRTAISAAHAAQAGGPPLGAAPAAPTTTPAPVVTQNGAELSEHDWQHMPIAEARKQRAAWNAKHNAH